VALCPDMVPFIDRRVDSRDLLQRSISRYEARKPARIAVGSEIEVVVKRMDADATQAEEKLWRLNQAGSQSWSALTTALSETRAAFDRANQAAQDAFRKAAA
jgi:hypothetical protein